VTLDETGINRLAFIKYLYNVAFEQSHRPEPLSSAAILTFHDAIELFLQLASEYLNVGKEQISFMDYWELLSRKLSGDGLTQKEAIRRLNKARVALKHHGTLPSNLDIEAFRASATNFFEENTPIVFGIRFSDVSLIELVHCADAKKNLKDAEEILKKDSIEDAIGKVALAFALLIDDYKNRKIGQYGRYPFSFSSPCSIVTSPSIPAGSDYGSEIESFSSEVESTIDDIVDSVEDLQATVEVICLGIDYRRYVKFQLLTPKVRKSDGTHEIYRRKVVSRVAPTMEDVQFCINFVIESAITLQKFDF
jgi:hypothetical protein